MLSGTLLPDFRCVLINVYTPNDAVSRRQVWKVISSFKSRFLDPWCVGSDFNEIRNVGERKGCIRRDRRMVEFNEFIEGLALYNVPMHGRRFSWSNSEDGGRWSRIDRVLLEPEWMRKFKFKLWGLPRGVFDHFPLILMEHERDWGPKPFRFLNAWSLHPKFLDVVKQSWEASNVSRWAGFIIATKLRYLKLELKKWNNEVFGNVSYSLKKAEVEFRELDLLAESRDLTEAEIVRQREVRKEMWSLRKKDEWDKNIMYFHTIASCRQNRNLLNSIIVERVLHEDLTTVKQEVFKHFKGLFTENWRNRPKLKGQFKSIGHDQVAGNLEAAFSKDKVWAAIKSCDGNKSLGSDGFNLICLQKCWEILKSNVLQFFKEFYENGKLVAGVNNSFITLIPKIECPTSLSDFRPFSLIRSLYKIVAKVLSHRIKKVMPRVVGEVQSAFLGGRNIMDGVLIANEIVDWWKGSWRKWLILKLDFQKAYDFVSWEWLLSMMEKFGFKARWRGWINECLASIRVCVSEWLPYD